jgi:hypothetical protein
MSGSKDEKRRDEILKRMLKTPPKPHKESSPKASKSDKEFSTEDVSGDGRQPFQEKKPSA